MNAVVIGAGMAGLVAARVLSERFNTVQVLDRDQLPDGGTPRRGVPQSAQPHVLLVSGLRELDGLFAGIGDELTAAGATRFDAGLGLCTFRYGRRWPKAPTGLDLVSASRPQLEAVVRDRVAALPGVTIRDRVTVTELFGDGDRVTGVALDDGRRYRSRVTAGWSPSGAGTSARRPPMRSPSTLSPNRCPTRSWPN